MNSRQHSLEIVAALSVLLLLTTGCAAVGPRDELPTTTVLLKCQFHDPDLYADYECLQIAPGSSPLTDVNRAARVKFVDGGLNIYEVVNCPRTENVDADFVCDDWIQGHGCKLRKLFSTSHRGEQIRWYQCEFTT